MTNGSTVCNSTIDNSTIDNSSVCTGSSLAITNVTITDSIVTETDAPNVQGVSSNTTNNNFNTGLTLGLYIRMSECVTVDNSSGNPRLLLETGSTDRYANYISSTCAGETGYVNFGYEIQSGDESCDLDYKATDSLELNGSTIRDNSSNNAVLTLPSPGANGSLGRNKEFTINDSGKC